MKYGNFVYTYPLIVLATSLVMFGALSYGYTLYREEKEIDKLWVPQDTQALSDKDKVREIFNLDSNVVFVYVVPKGDTNILTDEAFQELIEYELGFWSTVSEDGLFYNDICDKGELAENVLFKEAYCLTSNYPLQFFLNSNSTFEMPRNVLEKVNSGKGTSDLYPPDSSYFIPVSRMFGGTSPDIVTTREDGTNNIQSAEALKWEFYVKKSVFSYDFMESFEEKYERYSKVFSETSKYVSVHVSTNTSINRDLEEVFSRDSRLIYVGLILITLCLLYTSDAADE